LALGISPRLLLLIAANDPANFCQPIDNQPITDISSGEQQETLFLTTKNKFAGAKVVHLCPPVLAGIGYSHSQNPPGYIICKSLGYPRSRIEPKSGSNKRL
jgi:hypothetical protein